MLGTCLKPSISSEFPRHVLNLFILFCSFSNVSRVKLMGRFIVFYSWISSSFPRPPAKRAVAIALVNAFSQLGNIAGSYVWQMPENGFRKSYGIVIAMFGVAIAGCFWFRQILVGLNKKIDAAEQAAEAQGPVDAHKHDQLHLEGDREITGLQRGFRYLI
jgi:hypothetical protein